MPESEAILLRMEDITRRFPGVLALDRISFSLKKRSVHALVGQNGAGKSTLMHVLIGSIPKDEGRIFLEDREVDIPSTAAALELGLSCIHQEMLVVPDVSVAENIFLGDLPVRGALGRVDFDRMARRSREIFEEMGVELNPKRRIRGLGVAEQQLIMIARALHRQSRILIMDEPTASLDAREIENLFRIIRNLVSAGRSVIYISHYLGEIFKIADEVTILRNGRRVITSPVRRLDETAVIEHMLGYKEQSRRFARNENLGPAVLEVERLSSGSLLKEVSLTIRQGEVVGLAGLLGSGRTELVRALFGADPKSGGEIRVDGRPVSIRAPSDAVRLGLGLLTEERFQGIIPQFSVKHNITLTNLRTVSSPLRVNSRKEDQVAQRYVQLLGIKVPSVLQKIRTLSGGSQQKVIFAKWLHSGIRILFLDEPTKGIDVGAKTEILDMILDLARKGLAVVLISSEFADLARVCNRVLIMKKGRIVKELSEAPSDSFLQSEVNA